MKRKVSRAKLTKLLNLLLPACLLVMFLNSISAQTNDFALENTSLTETSSPLNNGNGVVEPGEIGFLDLTLVKLAAGPLSNVYVYLRSTTPGVKVINADFHLGTLTNNYRSTSQFRFTTSQAMTCGTDIEFSLTVTYDGGVISEQILYDDSNKLASTLNVVTISGTLGQAAPTGANFVSEEGFTSNGMLYANYIAGFDYLTTSSCDLSPNNYASAGSTSHLHVFTLTNQDPNNLSCVSITATNPNTTTPENNTYNVVVYDIDEYDYFNPTIGVIGHTALTPTGDLSETFSFEVPAGKEYYVAITGNQNALAPSSGVEYEIEISQEYCADVPCIATDPMVLMPASHVAEEKFTGMVGVSFSQIFTATGGAGIDIYSSTPIEAPGLALAANFSTNSAELYGTPTEAYSGSFKVYVGDALGCAPIDSSTYSILIDPCPIAISAEVSSNSPICLNSTLSLSVGITGTGGFTYQWSGPGGTFMNENSANPTVIGAVSGDYSVTVTNFCGSVTSTTSVIVQEDPEPIAFSNASICEGEDLVLGVDVLGEGPFTYAWSGPGQAWVNQNTDSPTVFGASSGDFTVTVTNSCGSFISATEVNVNTSPTISVSNSGPVCAGELINLNFVTTGGGPFTYNIFGPGGEVGANNPPSQFTIFGASTGIYGISATNACGTSLYSETDVVVNTGPPTMAIASSNSPLCPGESIELSVVATGQGPFSYAWTGPGNSWGGINTATPTVFGPASGDYSVTVTNACESIVRTTSVISEDTTPPVAYCWNRTIEIIGNNTTVTAADVNNNSTDDCGIESILLDGAGFVVLDDTDLGFNILTLTVTDFAGNSSTCESVVTVVPNLCPGSDGIDSDNGGLPDDCDCSPNDDFNDQIFLNSDVNTGMDFDGVDDFLQFENKPEFNPSLSNSITFEAWIKPDLTREFNTIISKGDGGYGPTSYIFETRNSNLRLFLGSSPAGSGQWFTATTPLVSNEWTHVLASYDHVTSMVTFYINGAVAGSESVSFTPYSTDTELVFIGRQGFFCGCNYFKGQMDEVRIWSRSTSLNRGFKDQELTGGEQYLLAYYNFNDGIPNGNNLNRIITKDFSPNGNHARLRNFTKNTPSSNWKSNDLALSIVNTETLDLCLTCPNVQNGGMAFDGASSYLEVDHHPTFDPSLTSSFTFEAWVNPTTTGNESAILSKGSGEGGTSSYIFSVISNKIGLYIRGQWIYSDSPVSGNTWTHVAVVYDHLTNTFTFYKNGIADGQRSISQAFYSDNSSVYIGQRGSAGYSKFLGKMDEVRIWRKARTAAEILADKDKKLYGGEDELAAYFNFDDGEAFGDNTNRSYTADVSLNGHEATLNGFAKTGNVSNWVLGPNNLSMPTNVAMNFDYLDDYISIANDPSLIPTASNSVTFEAWFSFFSTPYNNIITSSGTIGNNNHQISIENNKIKVAGNGVAPLLSVKDLFYGDGWTHIAVVFDKTETKLYINGVLDNTRVQTLASTYLGHPITLGSSEGYQSFRGTLDDVRYWDHARSPEEIQAAFDQELTGKEPGLAAYYNFNNGLAAGDNTALTIVPDVSDNGNDGTLSGFVKSGGASNWVSSPFNFGDLDEDGIPDHCDNCVFEKDLVIYDNLWKSVYRARETITLGNGMTMPANRNLTFKTPQLLLSDHIQTSANTQIMVTPFVCED